MGKIEDLKNYQHTGTADDCQKIEDYQNIELSSYDMRQRVKAVVFQRVEDFCSTIFIFQFFKSSISEQSYLRQHTFSSFK